MKKAAWLLLVLCLGAASYAGDKKGGSGAASPPPTGKAANPKSNLKTVLETIDADPSLAKFAAALTAADLRGSLRGAGPFTALAPNDAAVAKAAARWTDLLKPDEQPRLRAVLDAHLLGSKSTAADVAAAKTLQPIAGPAVAVALGADGKAVIGGVARIVKADVECSNGYVHVVDAVLLPAEKPAK